MANVGAIISNIRNIMRQDRGISGDAQRLEQLGWMLFLKIIDDKDKELEVIKDNYKSVIPTKFQWRNWAADPEGITGNDLLDFIDNNSEKESERGLFSTLRNLAKKNQNKRAVLVQEVFEGNNNYMKSGFEMRKVINKLNEVDFNNSKDKHLFGDLYESILEELRDAGNKGEYYTPRAITQLMTMMTDPKLGEKILDPSCGTGGFLTASIDYIRSNYVNTVEDEAILQNTIIGWELKPVAYVLGLTNLILHEIDVPDYHYIDSLKKEYNSIGKKDQVDVILANPPFGASIADGVETNFPSNYRCKESADLFVILMLQLLKTNGRSSIILPDGSITGEGVKSRIREKLLTDCNLHTIIRMPAGTFFPATVSTNLLFFEKGKPTNEIWFYEHRLPLGQKSYSKTKPIQFEEFSELIKWWKNRVENEVAWKVNVNDLKGFDLDIKNPVKIKKVFGNPVELYSDFTKTKTEMENIIKDLSDEVIANQTEIFKKILSNDISLLNNVNAINQLRKAILVEATNGNITEDWRRKKGKKENVKELISLIKTEKNKLIKSKKVKAKYDTDYFEPLINKVTIPDTWQYVTLGSICELLTGATPSKTKPEFFGGDIPWLVSGDIHKEIIFNCEGRITESGMKNSNCKILPIDSILMALNGQGKTRATVALLKCEATCNQSLVACKPFIDEPVLSEYIYYSLKAKYYEIREITGQHKRRGLNMTLISQLPIPLPPLLEQVEIVKKVKALMQKSKTVLENVNSLEQQAQILIQSVLNMSFETIDDEEGSFE
jgi:type I restriction enzyme M protein